MMCRRTSSDPRAPHRNTTMPAHSQKRVARGLGGFCRLSGCVCVCVCVCLVTLNSLIKMDFRSPFQCVTGGSLGLFGFGGSLFTLVMCFNMKEATFLLNAWPLK